MVARGDLVWADTGGPDGRRPVCILTRDSAIRVLERVVCAVVTSTVRGIASEVEVGPEHGLENASVINCDTLVTVPKHRLDPVPLGRLDLATRASLDRTLAYSLDLLF